MAAAQTRRMLRTIVGVITLLVIAFGTWRVLAILEEGPDSQRFPAIVLFKNAHGLRKGSLVRHRGMAIGEVSNLELDAAAGRVRVVVHLDPEAGKLATTTTEFWVVHPRFRGITRGLSGLDTLIKESYLRMRAQPGGEPLRRGEELLGRESTPEDIAEGELEDPSIGDLIGTVVLPERGGLSAGSPILYRGVETGEVRRVRLAAHGDGVIVRFRVFQPFRSTVRAASQFWVSRPVLRGNLLSGLSVEDLSSLLAVSLAYDSPSASELASDDGTFVGLAEPPELDKQWDGSKIDPKQSAGQKKGKVNPKVPALSPYVKVYYRAVEKDFFSGDDQVEAEGEGVLFRGDDGRLMVLTGRSVCDGKFLIDSHWYDKRSLEKERIRVVLADKRVWPARIAWIAPENRDLAMLGIQVTGDLTQISLPDPKSYLRFDVGAKDLAAAQSSSEALPRVLSLDKKACGIHGRAYLEDGDPRSASFSLVPKRLWPRSLLPRDRK